MDTRHLFIGLDSGTQATKGVVLDAGSGALLAIASSPHRLLEDGSGLREQDPAWWIAACEDVIGRLLSQAEVDPARVRGIGVSGQQHGMVPLDREGRVIRPAKLWCDTATAGQCATLTERLGGTGRVIELIGNAIAAGFTASKILWLAEKEPQNYARLATVLLPHDYINFWLTGERKTECGDASGTAYFDVRTRGWRREVLDAIDPSGRLCDCLPELIGSDQPVGVVRTAVARQFGLRGDVLVSSGGGDNMMAAIGTGNVTTGVVTTSLGTSGTIYAFAEDPIIDPNGELAAFCSSSGGWLPLVCTMNVTVATELIRTVLQLGVQGLNEEANRAAPGAGGVMLLPYFNGERTPALPQATASLHGLTATNFTRENLCRAAMEGTTLGLRYGLEVLRRLGVRATEIRLVGGGSKSTLWRQLVADVFACPVVTVRAGEAAALGAAIQAVWCQHSVEGPSCDLHDLTTRFVAVDREHVVVPTPASVTRYEEIYQRYAELTRRLHPGPP